MSSGKKVFSCLLKDGSELAEVMSWKLAFTLMTWLIWWLFFVRVAVKWRALIQWTQ